MTKRVVAPRFPTPATPASGSGAARLPDDVVDEQVRRVWLFSGISAFMWSFGLVMDGVAYPAVLGATVPRSALVVDVIAVIVTLTIFVTLRYAPIPPRAKVDAGLGLMLLNVFGARPIRPWPTPRRCSRRSI